MNGESRPTRLSVKLVVLAVCLAAACFSAGCGARGTSGSVDDSTGATVPPPSSSAQGTDQGSQGTSVTDVTMPPPDSPNLRIYEALGWDQVYVLYWLQMQEGWAYVHGIPFTSTDGPTLDTRALLRQDQGGQWQVVEKSINEGLLTDVGQVAVDQEIPAEFRHRHPEAPAGIFPEVKSEDSEIMDAVRTALGDPGYRFNVFMLSKEAGWAYTELRALSYRAGRIAESREQRALLRLANGVWSVLEMDDMQTTSQGDFVAGLKQRYPDLPASVLP
jgi:hypothetical protein